MIFFQIISIFFVVAGLILILSRPIAYITSRELSDPGGALYGGLLTLLIGILLCSNNIFGREQLVGTIVMIQKDRADTELSTTIESAPSISIKKENFLLEEYQVAIQLEGQEKVVVLNNMNSLFHLKFDQTAMQIQLQQGEKYSFIVAGLVGKKNIIHFERVE